MSVGGTKLRGPSLCPRDAMEGNPGRWGGRPVRSCRDAGRTKGRACTSLAWTNTLQLQGLGPAWLGSVCAEKALVVLGDRRQNTIPARDLVAEASSSALERMKRCLAKRVREVIVCPVLIAC